MTDTHEIWNLSALCRCCHSDGYFKSLRDSYVHENGVEIYANMLREAINVQIRPPKLDASYTICDACILRLQDAYQFRKQVLACEKKFDEYCENELESLSNDESIRFKTELDDGCNADDEFTLHLDNEIHAEENVFTKKEENDLKFSPFENNIKCEEDSKSLIDIVIPTIIKKSDAEGTEQKKKRVRKKLKAEPKHRLNYDSSLEVHVKTDSGILYSCKVCGGGYSDQKYLKRHIQTNHTSEVFKCMYCDKTFDTAKSRTAHLKKTHIDKQLKCSYCEKFFYGKYSLRDHENTHTKSRIFKCDLCGKEFAYKATLRMHLKGHYGTKKRCICHICGNGFNDRANLDAHVRTVHEKLRPFACELCPKTFTANKHLKVHIRKHTGEMPYACDQCPKRFHSHNSLTNHKITHLDKIDRYVCKVCRKRFIDRGLFLKHLRKSHVGQRPFKCDICDKDFTCKYSMKRHVIEHSGVKPHECDQCGAKFSQKGALKRHADRKHAAPKEGIVEKCDICNKNVTDLKKHMLCHNNKKYPCEYCDKSYSENNVLTRHKKVVHFGIKPHVCEFCDKKYVKINSLKNHQLKVHKIVSKIETDEDFDSAVAKFSIKNKKGKIKTEGGMVIDIPTFT